MREFSFRLLRLLSNNIKDFGVHSFRSDGANAAANYGIPDRLFKRHDRWKSETTKIYYIKDDLKRIFSVSQNLCLSFCIIFSRSLIVRYER
jgi:hypothetical protein